MQKVRRERSRLKDAGEFARVGAVGLVMVAGVDQRALREAAWAQLAALANDPAPAPLVMRGDREAAFIEHLLKRLPPQEAQLRLGLSLEEIAGGCIRVLRSNRRTP